MQKIQIVFIAFIFSTLFSCLKEGKTYEMQTPDTRFLIKSESLTAFYEMGASSVSIYASEEDKKMQTPECVVYYKEIEDVLNYIQNISFEEYLEFYKKKGTQSFYDMQLSENLNITPNNEKIRIAIDAGHIASNFEEALMEERFMKIIGGKFQFYEARNTWAVAAFLFEILENEGFEVMLTREKAGYTAFGKTYKEWLTNDFQLSLEQSLHSGKITEKTYQDLLYNSDAKTVFNKYFRNLEMEERARKINEFQPNITLIIHFNVSPKPQTNSNQEYYASNENFNMTFVPGSFTAGELDSVSERAKFLRLLLSGDIQNSVELSSLIIRYLSNSLKVPAVSETLNVSYLQDYCIYTNQKGVFARNLALNRMIYGTQSYVELFCQDNFAEAELLSQENEEVMGEKVPLRTKEAAEAIAAAIKHYIELQNK